MRHAFAYLMLRLLLAAVGALPLPLARALGGGLGRGIGRLAWRSRREAARGLGAAGAPAGAVSAHFADLGRRVVELALARRMLAAGQVVVSPEVVAALAPSPRGTLVLTAHYGHWELLGAALAAAGVPVHSVAARTGAGPLHRWLSATRAALGMVVHPPGTGAREVLARLRAGHPVALFFDLPTGERARVLPFLGRDTLFPRTAERLLAVSGANAVRVWTVRGLDGRYAVDLARLGSGDQASPPASRPVGDPLGEAVAALERAIRADPAQWVWMEDRWREGRGTVRLA